MAAYLLRSWPESKCANGGWIARLIWVIKGQNADRGEKRGPNVGAGLLAKAVGQSTHSVTDPVHSRASPLPHF
ncbi:hypothetical protein DYL59_27290 [Pseudomonas kairouanensis]|uniref:Uncharacterized protein n=1 Tax=Pseudomonas kairouanensis TaxID=2293832 RepID=A0A4Z0AE88_9PSED|nr:hypothetical protein DYL59_27290 [Pseudomonas kairouanensis]